MKGLLGNLKLDIVNRKLVKCLELVYKCNKIS